MYDEMSGQSGRIYSEYRVPAADRNAESECRGIHLCGEKVWKGSKTGADTEGIAGLYVIAGNWTAAESHNVRRTLFDFAAVLCF